MKDLNNAEKEAIVLYSLCGHLDSMVNYVIFKRTNYSDYVELRFNGSSQTEMFSLLLADMLTSMSSELFGDKCNFIDALKRLGANPVLSKAGRAECFLVPLSKLEEYLREKKWISVNMQVAFDEDNIKASLWELYSICGNIVKHNPLHLTTTCKYKTRNILKRSGIACRDSDVYKLYDAFMERFQYDVFLAVGIYLAQLLSELRWGIHEYLLPEFHRSFERDPSVDDLFYRFKIPEEVRDEFASHCYWELMNKVRLKPSMEPFVVREYWKKIHNYDGSYV